MEVKFINLQILQMILSNTRTDSYTSKCPYPSERRLRAIGFCHKNNTVQMYSCLFDTNEEQFSEHCNHNPDYSAPGEKYVQTGSTRNVECDTNRFQPFSLWSNQSSNCIFLKTDCSEEGQVVYGNGSTIYDRTCGCDYSKGYTFFIQPIHQCFCRPIFEDCSCTLKECPIGQILNADYICSYNDDKKHSCEAIENFGINRIDINDSVAVEVIGYSFYIYKVGRIETNVALVAVALCVTLASLSVTCCFILLKRTLRTTCSNRVFHTDIDKDEIKIVVGIDLGTTYTGFAFSSKKSFNSHPLDIKLNDNWIPWSGSLISLKAPTSVLIYKSGKCSEFGFDAEKEYIDQILDKQDADLFFYRFKMKLYENEDFSDNWKLEDINGRKLPAIDVFAAALSKLTCCIKCQIKKYYPDVPDDTIKWVLTVPAIWTHKAKEFMRRAAEKAGIQENRLLIALEPESVSVYFQYVNDSDSDIFSHITGEGISSCNYLVIDIGGGTIEITAHKSKDRKIEELCKPSGCCWGSTKIDEKFLDLIQSIVGEEVMQEMKSKHTDSYFDMLREIENFKSKLYTSNRREEYFKYPLVLNSLCESHLNKSFAEAIEESKFKSEINIKVNKLKIGLSMTIISSFFNCVIDKIISEIQMVLSTLKPNIRTFIVVGGLSKSPMLKKTLEEAFPGKKVIVPEDAEMAVSKGAVLCGHRGNFIVSRIMPYTFGMLKQPPFNDKIHDPKKRQTFDGIDRCNDCFEILVNKGASVAVRDKITKEYKILSKDQTKIKVDVYTTQTDGVKYVDEKECELFCEVLVDIPAPMTNKKRTICVEFEFGNPEFNVTAFDKRTKKPCCVSKHVHKLSL